MLRFPFYELFFLYLIKLTCSLFLNFTSSVWPQVLCWFFPWSPLSMLSVFLLAFTLLSTVPIGASSLHLNDWRKVLEKILFGDHNLLGSAWAQKKQGTCLSSYCQGTPSVMGPRHGKVCSHHGITVKGMEYRGRCIQRRAVSPGCPAPYRVVSEQIFCIEANLIYFNRTIFCLNFLKKLKNI